MKYLIVGAGAIAREYAKILNKLKVPFSVVCRSVEKAEIFSNDLGCEVISGGIQNFLNSTDDVFDGVINAVDTSSLFETNLAMAASGRVRSILSEKPGALHREQFLELTKACEQNKVDFYLAYNRREFASVRALKQILSEGVPTTLFCEFTEWFWKIDPSKYSDETMREWLLCNSSHVLDMAFFLGEGVEYLSSDSRRTESRSLTNTQYVGHGRMKNGMLFSYIADWESAGRWKLEASTSEGRYMLCPLEKLFFQRRGTLEYVEVPIEDEIDKEFKPGFFRQTEAFIKNDSECLKTLEQQLEDMEFFEQIKG